MAYIPTLITAAVLIYGGIIDYRKREIPDLVPIILIAVGIGFGVSTFWCIMGMVVPAALMLMVAKLTKNELSGGDFKLLCALGFACGLGELAILILLSGIGALAYGLIMRLPLKRHIPLCTYIAPAYITLQVVASALKGGGVYV